MTTLAERYDQALARARHRHLPPAELTPRPSAEWPSENVELLERYHDWLVTGGMSQDVIEHLYIPTAGYVLGLALKPYPELDLDADLACALEYVRAKRLSVSWTKNSRRAIEKFRQFLRQERGLWDVPLRPLGHNPYCADLPAWLVELLERYHHLKQSRWRPARAHQGSLNPFVSMMDWTPTAYNSL